MKRKTQPNLRTLLAYARERAALSQRPYRVTLADGLMIEWRTTAETVTLTLSRHRSGVGDAELGRVRFAAQVPAEARCETNGVQVKYKWSHR